MNTPSERKLHNVSHSYISTFGPHMVSHRLRPDPSSLSHAYHLVITS